MVIRFDRALLPPAPDFSFEAPLWESGLRFVAGLDEAGRGALAGPVAAAAIIFPPDPSLLEQLEGVRDSKEMTAAERETWAGRLPGLSLAWGVGFASHLEIDRHGIVASSRLAMTRALGALEIAPQHLLLDWMALPDCPLPQTSLVKGDARSLSIAAASILAKTARDGLLRKLDEEYPGYGFALHKGYGTAAHLAAIECLGPCAIHRQTFRPIKDLS